MYNIFLFQICEALWNMLFQRRPCEAGKTHVRAGCHPQPRILGHGKICPDVDNPAQVRLMLFSIVNNDKFIIVFRMTIVIWCYNLR